jgi:hypothetical protein
VLVYDLRFVDPPSLQAAYDVLIESERVVSCTVEADLGRVRFLAPVRFADALVARIYLEGGLTWCSRHAVREP